MAFEEGGLNMSNPVPEKLQRYVVTDLPKYVEVGGHHQPAPFWVMPDMFPGVKLRVAGAEASTMVGSPHADPHTHEGPEIYLAPCEEKGAVVIEVQMDDEKFLVDAPFAVFIPPGVKHCFKVVTCQKPHYILGIMLLDWEPSKL
jgi:quercetin dioxygenase-like cupin family protein